MAKFTGPEHITSINLSIGPVAVENGVAEIVGELTQGDVAGLIANGFKLVPEGVYFAMPAPEPEPEPVPDQPSPAAIEPAPETPE
jgi:hypothetical protein